MTQQRIRPASESRAMITQGNNTAKNQTSQREQGNDNSNEITQQGIRPVSESRAMITQRNNTARNQTSEREQGNDNPRK
ncbi:hypothetical protein RRG08_016449 [Elysia crispata]|uniref:Uncharacterized protein n=1 Tax=Elysia crispata TaxID=231223 RepID=A0AAE0Y8T8_9GAST|nr:hypothetical protein RRG08_016449 [Elysia crispata]